MSFDIFEKDFHILQEISFCPVGPLISHTSDPISKKIYIMLYHIKVEEKKDYFISNLHKCKEFLHPLKD